MPAVEHSDSRFESIRRFILVESIRFVKKNQPFDSAAGKDYTMCTAAKTYEIGQNRLKLAE